MAKRHISSLKFCFLIECKWAAMQIMRLDGYGLSFTICGGTEEMKCEQASTGKADELSTNSISPLEASNLRQPRGTQSEREPLDKPHHSCYAGLFKEIL